MYKNPEADKLFRFYAKRSREMNVDDKYIPFSMSKFLEHMYFKQRRNMMHERLDS